MFDFLDIFIHTYSVELTQLLILVLFGATLSAWLVKPLMYAFLKPKTAKRWLPVGFFIINVLFLLVLAVPRLKSGTTEAGYIAAGLLIIPALSAALYAGWPTVKKWLKRKALLMANGDLLRKSNGGSKED